ncbi:GerMN domain-containing protein [Blastococcus sp. VKM Ac-2987]|uniref:GerMN domain-containing protein n=1 Tax=Blastococcus sp. VKM Ac-2987 TaxID=3004141 RepID=UPI0022AB8BE3|nr:GerMN domain-containing protein [Blastococcus sp. VKM Ac-2987]MCZ2860438.1 GerMN domain-containing protein [Blastococcus sp. VKM Ac-2987]
MRAVPALLCALLLLAGCGVEPQGSPEVLTIPVPEVSAAGERTEANGPALTVYFVQGTTLAAAERATQIADAPSALELLSQGPTRVEVIGGLRTALAPQSLLADEGVPGGITSVSVTREFTGITGGNQLLAVAQVVWTLTDLPGTTQVRFLVEGVPVEVPTDSGLTDQPVDRDHFRSVAPAGDGPSSPQPPAEEAD